MPALIGLYLTALLYDHTFVSCMALAEGLEAVLHGRLARLLPADCPGHTPLELAVRTLSPSPHIVKPILAPASSQASVPLLRSFPSSW
jgi:hypothetical protein